MGALEKEGGTAGKKSAWPRTWRKVGDVSSMWRTWVRMGREAPPEAGTI